MGRTMDGVQKRRNQSARKPPISTTSGSSHGSVEEFDWAPSSFVSPSTNQTDPFSNARGNSDLDQLASESMALWDESRNLQQHDLSVPDASRELSSGSGFLMRDIDNMDFEDIQSTLLEDDYPPDINFQQLTPSPSPWPPSQQQPHQTHPSSDTSPPTSSSSRFLDAAPPPSPIQTWTALLEQLSLPLNQAPIPLDSLLHTTSTLIPHAIHALRSLPIDPSCLTPLILIALCLTQAITLFEQCLLTMISRLTVSRGPPDLALRLGAFQVDREVQAALQRYIVAKEVTRILHAARTARQVLRNPGLSGAEKRAHGLVVEDLVRRIKVLGALVTENR